ncbi:GntR family transcriptional regulator [Paralimibaculum aggregatum]|uniref:GntR family transcriptional regulator n=1 Tax=Paralimibaculum aggregatum TaxID=3036245 RepID=A0ABQ6LTK6_9RHOB|nr:GntR family transcriptional regulator [Limibaculum sp. NKW23]GMG85435.1 GntR family transcriptional regulator [Limibaculum sp. NKW23]
MGDAADELAAEFVRRYWSEEEHLPKHERLRLAFADSISDGFWKPGTRLPTEAELVQVTPCSLGTVQRALRALSDEGLIERRRGSGSVVADVGPRIADPWHIRYVDPSGSGLPYYPVETRVVARRLITDRGPWSEPLGQGAGRVVKIDRIFTVDQRIEIYSEFYALEGRFPDLEQIALAQLDGINFKRMLAKAHRIPFHRIRQRLRFAVPPPHVAPHVSNGPGGAVPVLSGVALALNGEANYYQDFHLPLDEGELDLGFATKT